MTQWLDLDYGAYNFVYVNSDKTLVFKKVFRDESRQDTPERSVRLWNQINGHLGFLANTADDEGLGKGWTCPYIDGKQASDEEITHAVIDIYNRTGRIIVDAPSSGNFLKTNDPVGQIVCVDIGFALQMQIDEELFIGSRLKRRNSEISIEAWSEFHDRFYGEYYDTASLTHPKTVKTLKALLFIAGSRPDIFNVDFLKNLDSCDLTTLAYGKSFNADAALALLEKKIPPVLTLVKESCIEQLHRYINSRGIMKNESFRPSIWTRFFRNTELTTKKVDAALKLINNIKTIKTPDELEKLVSACKTKELLQATFFSGFAHALGKCLLIVNRTRVPEKPSVLTPIFK